MFSNGSSPVPSVTFWGAAQSVTGSQHLVEIGGLKLLLDCGSSRRAPGLTPPGFVVPPEQLDAVILSHAHTDHCGSLPRLVREGFAGPIYCTAATRDLLALMLAESARHAEEDARVLAVLGRAVEPYGPSRTARAEAWQTVQQCVVLPYDRPTEIGPGVELRLADAGHLLGSAMVHLALCDGGRDYCLSFTGDVGRPGLPLLRPPAAIPPADLVICESTYGGRNHEPPERLAEALHAVVRRTAERGGKVLVPAFSLGRTQAVVHVLQQGMLEGRVPPLPVYVDSPLAADIAGVYRAHPEQLAETPDLLHGPQVEYVRSLEESHEVGRRRGPCVLVAAGGMCEGGRILHHLKHHIDDPRCSVVLVSYQAPHTPGRRLLERGPTVRLHGRTYNKWADVIELPGFSGHAGHDDLLAMLEPLAGTARKVCLVHGEPEGAGLLARDLERRGFDEVLLPAPGEVVSVA
jgi:metallo-beta-lactamase family protein